MKKRYEFRFSGSVVKDVEIPDGASDEEEERIIDEVCDALDLERYCTDIEAHHRPNAKLTP